MTKSQSFLRLPRRALLLLLTLVIGALAAPAFAEESPPPVAEPGPENGVIEGQVLIEGVREPVPAATVKLVGTTRTVETDEQGRFRFDEVPPGSYYLTVAADTIEEFTLAVVVKPGQTATAKCYVKRTAYLQDEVVVTAPRQPEQTSSQEISAQELDGVPGANNDVIRVVENMPGVASVGPGGFGDMNGLVIRGVSADNSLYLFNGFGIPQLFHFGALVSTINAELIDDITYYPGGFGVKYGQALGGVVEVTSRSPRTDRIGGVVDLSTYSSYVMFEGPAGPNFSWAGSVRRSFIDFILPAVIPEDQASFTLSPTFYDYSAILEYRPDPNNLVRTTFVGADDRVGLVGQVDTNEPFSGSSFDSVIDWHQGSVRWDAAPTGAFTNSLAANLLYFQTENNFGENMKVELAILSPVLREEFTLALGSWNQLRAGMTVGYARIDLNLNVPHVPSEGHPMMASNDEISHQNFVAETVDGTAYLDDVMKPAPWVQIIPGVRVDYTHYLNRATADPRLLTKFFVTDRATIKAAAGIYHQWPDYTEITEGYGNPDLRAEVAYEGVLGGDYDFGQGWSLGIESYYKYLDDLATQTEAGDDVPYRNTGVGYIYGGELLARKRLTDRLFGWVSYTYSVSMRRDTPDDDWRYFDQDQRHNFIILANYTLGESRLWRIGAKWQFQTSTPYTAIVGSLYDADTDTYQPIYSEDVNGEREKPYHQLDLRVDKLWVFRSWTLNTYLDVQNVYWNQYPAGYMYNYNYTERKPVSFALFLPSIGLDARF